MKLLSLAALDVVKKYRQKFRFNDTIHPMRGGDGVWGTVFIHCRTQQQFLIYFLELRLFAAFIPEHAKSTIYCNRFANFFFRDCGGYLYFTLHSPMCPHKRAHTIWSPLESTVATPRYIARYNETWGHVLCLLQKPLVLWHSQTV